MSGDVVIPDELRSAWTAGAWRPARDDATAKRAAGAPEIAEVVAQFRGGDLDLAEFVATSRKLGFAWPYWGFKAFGQMTLNQFAKIAITTGTSNEIAQAFRAVLPVPADIEAARTQIADLAALAVRVGELAERNALASPGPGHAAYIASYFWDVQAPRTWPVYYKSSRDALGRLGLFEPSGDLAEDYARFAETVRGIALDLGGDLSDVEHVLFRIGAPAAKSPAIVAPPSRVPAVPPPPGIDAYALYRETGLSFPDEVITSFLLALWTKPFSILSGISGTGKTQIALRLASALNGEATSADPGSLILGRKGLPQPSERVGYLRTSTITYSFGRLRPLAEQLEAFPLPERGTTSTYDVTVPSGERLPLRLRNVGFTDVNRKAVFFEAQAPMREWLRAHTRLGDVLALEVTAPSTATLSIVKRVDADQGEPRHALIPVRPDWTDGRALLGYWNPLTEEYATTPFLDLLLRAAADPARPYFAILDEMNLARVEYYFADILSAMESGEPIPLHASEDDEVPASVFMSPNLFVIGTVNVDETTHAFSAKVLDRAFVHDFHDVDVNGFFSGDAAGIGLHGPFRLVDPLIDTTRFRVADAASPQDVADAHPIYPERVSALHALLRTHHRHFGYRVLGEMTTFVALAAREVGDDAATCETALDLAIVQKVLPKLNGGRELEEPLGRLLAFLLDPDYTQPDAWRDAAARYTAAAEPQSGIPIAYPRSAAKVARMLGRLDATGFVSFLE